MGNTISQHRASIGGFAGGRTARLPRASPEKHCDHSCPKCGRVYLIDELLDKVKDVIEARVSNQATSFNTTSQTSSSCSTTVGPPKPVSTTGAVLVLQPTSTAIFIVSSSRSLSSCGETLNAVSTEAICSVASASAWICRRDAA